MKTEIREISRDIANHLDNHRIISSVFSAAQLSSDKGTLPLSFGHRGNIWYILSGRRTTSAAIVDYMFYTYEQDRSASERPAVLGLVDDLNREYDSSIRPVKLINLENSGDSTDIGFPVLMVDTDRGEIMKGAGYNLGNSLDDLIGAGSLMPSNFPHPYHLELDGFLKSLFLTRGLSLKPPLSRKFIMENLVEDTYQHSIGIKRETIKREFQEILREMVSSRVFRVKGAYVTYLTDMTEYRRRYQREYLSYIDKISKKTIFDY